MDGVLLLAHGSRAPESVQTMESIAEQTRRLLPEQLIQVAFMQFNDVNIEKGLLLLMTQGVTRVKIVPYFLFDGVHIKEDIPQEVAEFKAIHPQIEIVLGQTLGTDARLAQIVAERIEG
ncbi:MAG: CbiX/SirB N-terminal domain-containing protein [Oscillospiraceae bacterium]|nr:CbiX/SirB N-terminal domain-containing protein [Oscillospiraceae bacterium]